MTLRLSILMSVLIGLAAGACGASSHNALANPGFEDGWQEGWTVSSNVICDAPGDIASGAMVVVSSIPILAEPDPEPLDAGMLEDGMLGVGLDYDVAWTQAAIRSCDKFVSDDIGQLMHGREHSGHLRKIPDTIYAELGEIAAGMIPGRESNRERIFSMQMGIGIEDLATAKLLYDRAVAIGAGIRLPL